MQTGGFQYAFSCAAKVDRGNIRQTNQDAIIYCPDQGFFAVVDGMGGLPGGGETAAMLETILPAMASRLRETLPEGYTPELAGEALSGAIGGISDKLFEQKNADGRINFGAALCALLLVDRCAVIVNLGDCRCYWMGRGAKTMTRLTTDHNIAADMVAAGILSPEAARKSGYSARLTRFAGMPAPAVPGIAYKRLSEGDQLALCSDGLYGEVEEADIAAAMQSGLAPHEFCEMMIANAKEHGGRDNISLIMISL